MERTPMSQGYDAYCAGIKISENPYIAGTDEAFDWNLGWSQAWEDHDTAKY